MASERILIVEDEHRLLDLLQRILRNAGYNELQSVADARQALPVFRRWRPDLVIMDIGMPHLDGVAVMQQLRSRLAAHEYLPVLLITGDAAAETKQRALTAGASDFLTKPFEASEVLIRIRNLLQMRGVQRDLGEARLRAEEQIDRVRLDSVRRLTLAAEHRKSEGSSDPQQVGELSAHIARTMGLAEELVERIRLAAPLHDIGMMGVPDAILGKQDSLSLEEMDRIREHTSIGARILGNSPYRVLQLAEEIALYHHEAWDGSGYTPGLSGESIPLAARIVAVADTYCAMIGNRSWRSAHSAEQAATWIESQAGRRFDPDVVRAFQRVTGIEGLPMLDRT